MIIFIIGMSSVMFSIYFIVDGIRYEIRARRLQKFLDKYPIEPYCRESAIPAFISSDEFIALAESQFNYIGELK